MRPLGQKPPPWWYRHMDDHVTVSLAISTGWAPPLPPLQELKELNKLGAESVSAYHDMQALGAKHLDCQPMSS